MGYVQIIKNTCVLIPKWFMVMIVCGECLLTADLSYHSEVGMQWHDIPNLETLRYLSFQKRYDIIPFLQSLQCLMLARLTFDMLYVFRL